MSHHHHILTLLSIVLTTTSCSFFQKHGTGVIAEYDGYTITQTDIDHITTGLTGDDSARVAEAYIQQWATTLIEYNKAKDVANKDIEQLVEDYRHSLYIHNYEERLIQQRMPKQVDDSLIQQFYDAHQQQFTLHDAIVKGVLLTIPNGAPKIDKLEKWLQAPQDEENIELIEKYAYQYASGYELFLDDWKTATQLLLRMPFEKNDFLRQLKTGQQIHLQDSTTTYLLQITAAHSIGEPMPLDYAAPEIQKILLSQRQVDFIQEHRQSLYQQAIREHRIYRAE